MKREAYDYYTGKLLPGRVNPMLAKESFAERSGTGAVKARKQNGVWLPVSEWYRGETTTVYIVEGKWK